MQSSINSMEAWLILLLIVIGLIFILPPIALVKAIRAQREIENLKARLRALEDQRLSAGAPESVAGRPSESTAEEHQVPPAIPLMPVPLPPLEISEPIAARTSTPPPLPQFPEPASPPPPSRPPRAPINWEQFMGAKMFAWIGGLALFLGVAFFVK
jgi:uncharacterized membrane protein